MALFVKICGLAHEADVKAVMEMKPDALGFVFWSGSARFVTPEDVGVWTQDRPASMKTVGVFVDATAEEVQRTVDVAGLDVVQLHGGESPEFCSSIDGDVWKALHLDRTTPNEVAAYDVDAFLIDSYSIEAPGGTGKTVDWNRAREFVVSSPRPVLLAGGLTAENVSGAAAKVNPWGVDVSSGVEERKAKKDLAKVRAFIESCRKL